MKYILIIFFILLNTLLSATILEVGNSGQTYQSIQSAIHSAVSGDTVLVYPGRYFENLLIGSKSLTLSSLYLLSGDESDIDNTIIDGSEIRSCLYIFNSHNASIIGLTFEHGKGTNVGYGLVTGGGVFVRSCENILLKSNKIQFNRATTGGGLSMKSSRGVLSSNLIRFNEANSLGGLLIELTDIEDQENTVVFDAQNKNSIYANTSHIANDIYIYGTETYSVILKKGSSATLSNYWVVGRYSGNDAVINYSCEEEYFAPIDDDVYVSTYGNDNNTGTSPDQALRNIYTAVSRIQSDPDQPKNIFVAPGVYTPVPGQELLPIQLKSGISLIGINGSFTIDGANKYSLFNSLNSKNISIENMIGINIGSSMIKDDGSAFYIDTGENFKLKNVELSTSMPFKISMLNFMCMKNLSINNLNINNPIGYNQGMIGTLSTPTTMDNVLINGGRRAFSFFKNGLEDLDDVPVVFSNVGIFNTSNMNQVEWGVPFMGSTVLYEQTSTLPLDKNYFVNWTVANNTGYYGPMSISGMGTVDFYNSIFYNNSPNTIGFRAYQSSLDTLYVNFNNCSFFEESDSTFVSFYNAFQTETECIYGDPLFRGEGQYPFSLSLGSPCIDAGTNDLPEGISLPERDLSGNLRVIGSAVDIGAYEFNPLSVIQYPEEVIASKPFKCSVYPNPIDLSLKRNLFCNFDVEFTRDDDIDFSIYNIKGQKIITLAKGKRSPGMSRFNWDGKDENQNKIGSGVYLYKITGRDSEVSGKFTVID